jgi:hypothetical protein
VDCDFLATAVYKLATFVTVAGGKALQVFLAHHPSCTGNEDGLVLGVSGFEVVGAG